MKIDLLDHGYALLVESWGSDQAIIEAARMSTDKGFLGWGRPGQIVVEVSHPEGPWWLVGDGVRDGQRLSTTPNRDRAEAFDTTERAERAAAIYEKRYGLSGITRVARTNPVVGDEKLLRYLWENKHSTPFEMAGLTVESQAPIMVYREWHRHRVPFGYSELSARYTPLPDVNYTPEMVDLVARSKAAATTKNRQAGATGAVLDEMGAIDWLMDLSDVYQRAQHCYERGLALGVPKELARLPVPVGRYSRMRATGNLRGWLAFLTLRMAPTAQYEIRVYANAVGQMIAEKFPRTWELFAEGQK